eukprot:5160012-Amphidinium_carterae.2
MIADLQLTVDKCCAWVCARACVCVKFRKLWQLEEPLSVAQCRRSPRTHHTPCTQERMPVEIGPENLLPQQAANVGRKMANVLDV